MLRGRSQTLKVTRDMTACTWHSGTGDTTDREETSGHQGLGVKGKGLATNGPEEPFCNGGHIVGLDAGGHVIVCTCQNAWHCVL